MFLRSLTRTSPKRLYIASRSRLLDRRNGQKYARLASTNRIQPLPLGRMYQYLDLHAFTEDEIGIVFDRIRLCQEKEDCKDEITVAQVQRYLQERIRSLDAQVADDVLHEYSHEQALRMAQLFVQNSQDQQPQPPSITRSTFINTLLQHASTVDTARTIPIAASMLLVGASVGLITPAMPFVVQQVGLTHAQYGNVVSAFALSKLLSNVPAAVLAEQWGRKPGLTYSLGVIAVGVGGIGFASSFGELYLCRLLTGVGVAALSTASTLFLTDVSTPLNRASTMAPIMSAFAAGTALGPALGGYLVDAVGLQTMFALTGVSYLGVAVLNRNILDETKPTLDFPWTQRETPPFWTEASNAVAQWIPLAQNPSVRTILIMNAFYWMSLAGSQMTLLPLLLTDVHGMTATQIGQVYMGMSTVQIVGNPLFARVMDRVGKIPAMVGGCTLIGSSMAVLTLDWNLVATLGLWSVGSSMLSTAPVAYVSDNVDDTQRAQAIAMLRTSGDVGFLVGASVTGAWADWTSLELAMQSSAGMLLLATTWFGVRQYALRVEQQKIAA